MNRALWVLIVISMAAVACSRVDPITALEPTDVVTGWYDEGIVDGKNKLVPSVSLKLRNKSDVDVRSVQGTGDEFREDDCQYIYNLVNPGPGTYTVEILVDGAVVETAEFTVACSGNSGNAGGGNGGNGGGNDNGNAGGNSGNGGNAGGNGGDNGNAGGNGKGNGKKGGKP